MATHQAKIIQISYYYNTDFSVPKVGLSSAREGNYKKR